MWRDVEHLIQRNKHLVWQNKRYRIRLDHGGNLDSSWWGDGQRGWPAPKDYTPAGRGLGYDSVTGENVDEYDFERYYRQKYGGIFVDESDDEPGSGGIGGKTKFVSDGDWIDIKWLKQELKKKQVLAKVKDAVVEDSRERQNEELRKWEVEIWKLKLKIAEQDEYYQ